MSLSYSPVEITQTVGTLLVGVKSLSGLNINIVTTCAWSNCPGQFTGLVLRLEIISLFWGFRSLNRRAFVSLNSRSLRSLCRRCLLPLIGWGLLSQNRGLDFSLTLSYNNNFPIS